MLKKIFQIILPHEIFFMLFLLVTWCRITMNIGIFSSYSIIYFSSLLLAVLGIVLGKCCNNTPKSWYFRFVIYIFFSGFLLNQIQKLIPFFTSNMHDALLQSIDQYMIGSWFNLFLHDLHTPFITNSLAVCYACIFFIQLFFSLLYYLCNYSDVSKAFYSGLFTIYALVLLIYTFIPAIGPDAYLIPPEKILLTGEIYDTLHNFYMQFINESDVFPSLHCAVSAYILLFDLKHNRFRFLCYIIPCVGMWFSTVYLQYNYLIDDLAGFLLAFFGLWIAKVTLKNIAEA